MPLVRQRHRRRARARRPARGPGRLTAAADTLLRPALEAAMAVARAGEDATPAQPAPPALRPFLRFARLPPRALVALRRALDTDAEFRARVAEEVSEDAVGRAGWLYLSRPDGWEDDLASLVRAAETAEEEAEDRRAETDARRRLAGAEAAVRRAEEVATTAQAEADRAVAALADERRARREAADRAAALDRRLTEADSARDRAGRRAAEAAAEAERLRARVAELEDRVRALEAAPPPPPPPPPPSAVVPAAEPPAALDGEAAGTALAAAAAAAAGLAESLSAAATALAPPPPAPRPEEPPPGPPAPDPDRGRDPRRRRPAPLPPGVLDDSPEAADHLVRLPGVAVVVDGYNVSQRGWPGLPIAEQRRRLVDALTELAARTGADVSVVFDGSDTAWPAPVGTTGRAVKVWFSPPGVEADDVVIERAAQLPPSRPVVVASSDRRVQDGARASGANVMSSAQLLAALRR